MNELWLHSLYTFLISLIPFTGLIASIPLGSFVWNLPLIWVGFLAFSGNVIVASILLKILPQVILFFDRRILFVRKFFEWIFENLKHPRMKKIILIAEFFLVLFVALPFPLTGVWIGCLLAYALGLKYKNSLPLISMGILLSVILISLLTLGSKWIFQILT